MSLKLYYNFLSQPSRALYIFMKKCNIPFEAKNVDLAKGEHFGPEFEQINPLKKVPVIVHNGSTIIESVAILRYLCREFEVDDHWYPKSSLQQARVDEYLEWQHHNTRAHLAIYSYELLFKPIITGKQSPPEIIEKLKRNMEKSLDVLENHWLKDKLFLAGDTVTVADLIGACELEQPRLTGYDPKIGRPRITAWMERVQTETSPFYEEAHKVVDKRFAKLQKSNL